jgi:hypothetical protein
LENKILEKVLNSLHCDFCEEKLSAIHDEYKFFEENVEIFLVFRNILRETWKIG